jgi:fructokinase
MNGTFGAIEAGGTKFVCGVGTGPADLETLQIPTTSPDATIGAAVSFLRQRGGAQLRAVGIASFGPLGLEPAMPSYGHITSTPKIEWRDCDLAGNVRRALDVPVGFDTDVNGAALGEAMWGSAQDVRDFVYLTVGTGIGGGAISGGHVVHGLIHPEMGHIRVPRNASRDPYPGICPYHRDCLEGLASGPAMEARWGTPGADLPADHPAWALEAHYLALGLANFVCTLSPRRIVMGGGVMQQTHLFVLIRAELLKLLNGYIQAPEILERVDEFVVPPRLGSRAGVLGALVLAEQRYFEGRSE